MKKILLAFILTFLSLFFPSSALAIDMKIISSGAEVVVNEPFTIQYSGLYDNGCYGFFASRDGISVLNTDANPNPQCSITRPRYFYSNILPSQGYLLNVVASQVGDYTIKLHRYIWGVNCGSWLCSVGSVSFKVVSEPSSEQNPLPTSGPVLTTPEPPSPTPSNPPRQPSPTPTRTPTPTSTTRITPTPVPVGTGGRGKQCSKSSECPANLICAAEYGNGGEISKCILPGYTIPENEQCFNSLECKDGDFFCGAADDFSSTLICRNRRLVNEPKSRGFICVGEENECSSGVTCRIQGNSNKKVCLVTNKVPIGQSCYDTKECKNGSECKFVKLINGFQSWECVASSGQQPPAGGGQQPQPSIPANPTPAPENATPVSRPNLQGKFTCEPEGGVQNRYNSDKITVKNNTNTTVTFSVQYNRCKYKGEGVPLPAGYECATTGEYLARDDGISLPPGQQLTFGFGLPRYVAGQQPFTYGSCDVAAINIMYPTTPEGCVRTDDGTPWQGGRGWTQRANATGYPNCPGSPGGSAGSGGTPTPTRPTYGQGTVRTYSCSRSICNRNSSSAQVCELQCSPNN